MIRFSESQFVYTDITTDKHVHKHNSSINIFQTPTLYTRMSSSHYQSMTISDYSYVLLDFIMGILTML